MEENKNVVTETAALITPIQAATRLGKAPQYIYQMLRNAKVPGEHIEMIAKGDGTYREMLKESFFEWFASRPSTAGRPAGTSSVKTEKVVIRQATVDELLAAMALKLEATGDKKFKGLVDALKATMPAGPEAAPQMEGGAAANA